MKRDKSDSILIPGQSLQLCRDIHQANAAGVTYGVYMGRKLDKEEREFREKFGVRKYRKNNGRR